MENNCDIVTIGRDEYADLLDMATRLQIVKRILIDMGDDPYAHTGTLRQVLGLYNVEKGAE